MALTQPSFEITFDADVDSATYGKLICEDVTDYGAEGIADADVIGYFDIIAPDGTYHQGSFVSPDIDGGTSFVFDTLAIPTDSNGELLQGTYTFSYYIRVSGAVQPGDYEDTDNTYDFCPCLVPVSLVAPIQGAAGDIDVEVNCFCLRITATDDTDVCVPTTDTRVFSLYPPPSLGLPTYTTNSATLTYNFQYTGGYEIELDRLLTYVTGIFTYTVRVKSSVYEVVQCDRDLCALVTCFNTYRTETLTRAGQYGGFQNLSKTEQDLWFRITGGFLAHDYNLRCGNYEEAGTIYTELKTLLKCNCSCTETDAPQLVNPYCSGTGSNNSITVVAAGAGITVSSVVVGDTTTYTVAVQQATLDQIATNTTDISSLTTIVNNILAGTTGNNYRLLYNATTAVGTIANTTETTLQSYSLPTSVWGGVYTGRVIITARFTLANNTNGKTVRIYFGAANYVNIFLPGSSSAREVLLKMEVSATAVNTQDIESESLWKYNPAIPIMDGIDTGSENLGGAVLIRATGENATASANDIICERLTVEYMKVA